MKVFFVGAGPGDPELLTIKAQRLLQHARLCIYAGSLINPRLLDLLPPDAERHDSAGMDLDAIVELFKLGRDRGIDVVRLHTGEPSLYGAIAEQMNALDRLEIAYEVVPGISSFQAAAASLRVELTVPEIAQTVILTRAPGRTPMPESEDLARLAESRATLCIFLSTEGIAGLTGMLAAHYGPDCPAALVFHASWPDEKKPEWNKRWYQVTEPWIMDMGATAETLADIGRRIQEEGIRRTAIFLVGRALARPTPHASKLYDKTFGHGYRPGSPP